MAEEGMISMVMEAAYREFSTVNESRMVTSEMNTPRSLEAFHVLENVQKEKPHEGGGEREIGCVSEKGVEEELSGTKRKIYSRSELEAIRFMDVDGQKRRWKELYSGLEAKVAREYDGLRIPNEQNKKKPGYSERLHSVARNEFETVDMVFSLNEEKDTGIFTTSRAANEEALMCGQNWMGNESYSESGDIDEHEEYEDDDSDDEYDSIQRLAFLVDGEPDFDSGPPLDGLEYLRRVRWEAKQIPKVKVAQLKLSTAKGEQTPYMPSIPKIEECPQNLLPSNVWEESFLADFSKLRQEFSELEASGIRPNEFTVASKDFQKSSVCRQKPKGDPTVTALLSMDPASRASILRRSIDLFEASSALLRADCLWLYALCATVDSPVGADTCASLRGLLRKCSSLLATKSELDDEVAMLNILIVIAGKYFGQSENR